LDSETALHVAVTDQYPDERIIDCLIKFGRADVSLENICGKDALHCLIEMRNSKNPKLRFNIIDKLLKLQTIPVDGYGWNILHHAVAANQLKVVKELLAEPPTIRNLVTQYKNNALSIGCAIKHINIGIIQALLDDNTTTYVSGEFMEETPLGEAIINERLDIVKLLMQRFPTSNVNHIFVYETIFKLFFLSKALISMQHYV
jgi:ankyrin repeat protein